ncbi:hypothetical protein Maq22A_c20330 [Methylobacterium aquaticum]|uniref:Uncharacterized protein n=1 Tax=Methylobacterium aquaticum TaxID=270351 RepID=A0A0C6FVD0_9HYPH|nr:hypothetical protein Maq22A_c20330 [Methylobacterium aquaticum]
MWDGRAFIGSGVGWQADRIPTASALGRDVVAFDAGAELANSRQKAEMLPKRFILL